MLALVLGSATHSFELMLSAFILGLALGAWWIRSRADRLRPDPHARPGAVADGIPGTATLPLYVHSFQWVADLLSTFARNDAGYTGFTIARYGPVSLIMLPATFCAGMTLPLITRTLIGRRIGRTVHRRGLRLEYHGLDSRCDAGRTGPATGDRS